MHWYDAAVIAVAAILVIRGWFRGLVREVVEVALLLLGTLVVFRLSGPIGTVLSAMANIPYEVGRIVAGVVIFAGLIVGSMVLGRVIVIALKVLPGGSLLNRVGGSAMGAVYAAVIVVLATTMISVLPLPDEREAAIDEAIGESDLGSLIVDPEGQTQEFLRSLSGESLYASVLSLRSVVGNRLAAGTLPIPLPTVEPSAVAVRSDDAAVVFAGLNEARVAFGGEPLTWSPDLAAVAETRAARVYVSRRLQLDGRLESDLSNAAIPGTIHTEAVVIASLPDGIIEAFESTSLYADALFDSRYRDIGVGVVDGPYGLVSVFVISA